MKHIDIEEKIIDNKSKVTKISLISVGSVLAIGLIVGLVLTIVNSKKPIVKSPDEIRSTYEYEIALKNTKTIDYEIKNLGLLNDDEAFKDQKFFKNTLTIKANSSKLGNKEVYFVSKYDEAEEIKYTNLNEVEYKLTQVVDDLFYHSIKNVLGGGLVYYTYETTKLFVDKKENDNYLLFDENGLLIEAYKEGAFSINKGKFYHE